MTRSVCAKCAKSDAVDFRNELLAYFNDYDMPLTMTAEQVREFIVQFYDEWKKE